MIAPSSIKMENEVLLTFLYLASSPSSELIRYKALVPPKEHLRISIARSILSSMGTPDIFTKKTPQTIQPKMFALIMTSGKEMDIFNTYGL